jgi:predicted nucleic acid-binding protein
VTRLVIDANVAFTVVASPRGTELVESEEPAAPPLLRSEVRSALHVARWRGLLTQEDAARALEVLESGVIGERRHRRLGAETWRIADELGWSKTYDAEYLALAVLLGVPIATFDRRMLRAAASLEIPVITLS